MKKEINGYILSKNWFNYKFENPEKVKSIHTELYFYIIDLWNRLGQKEKFGLPTSMTMECLGVGSYNTYKKALNGLIEFGFIILISESKNQYQSKIIAISNNDKASERAFDKASINALDEAYDKSCDIIIEQNNQLTTNNKTSKSHCDEITEKEKKENDDLVKKQNSKRKKSSGQKKEKVSTEFWKEYTDLWFHFYKSKFTVMPTFNATEGKHLKSIVSRFKEMAKEKDSVDKKEHIWHKDRAMRIMERFLNNAWSDKWLSEHFLLKNLASNFDSIINKKQVENEGTKQKSNRNRPTPDLITKN